MKVSIHLTGLLPILLILCRWVMIRGWVKNAAVGPNVSRTLVRSPAHPVMFSSVPGHTPTRHVRATPTLDNRLVGAEPIRQTHGARMRRDVHACCGPNTLNQNLGPVSQVQQGYVPLLAGHSHPHNTHSVRRHAPQCRFLQRTAAAHPTSHASSNHPAGQTNNQLRSLSSYARVP